MLKQVFLNLIDLTGLNAVFRNRHCGEIKVLLYHNVTDGAEHFDNALTPDEFGRHLRYLKRYYNVIGINSNGDWQGLRSDRVNVLISFDDGFRNNLTHALPVLQSHAVPCVFFLIAECIERGDPPSFLVERIGDTARQPQFQTVTVEDARRMIDAGMTIGSHSLRHENHQAMDDQMMIDEASQARSALEGRFAMPIAIFAFPWGKHRPGQEQRMLDVYRRVFLTRHGFCGPEDKIIPRNEVTTLAHLKAAASGALDGVRRIMKSR